MIREASLTDVPALVALGQQFRDAVYADRLPENIGQLAAFATQQINSPTGLVLLAEAGCGVVGMIGGTTFVHPLSGELTTAELFWFVAPEHRGSVGVRLLNRLKAWGLSLGATRFQVVAPTADVERLYERLGFHRVEVSYEMVLA